MYLLAGHLQPLNIFMVYRTLFADQDEAKAFLDSDLGSYTFFKIMTIAQVNEHSVMYKEHTMLVPVTACKHEGDTSK